MTPLDAMKQALEALEDRQSPHSIRMDVARASLILAIEQMEKQEPVGHVVEWLDGSLIHAWELEPPPVGTPLYTHPAPAVPVYLQWVEHEGWLDINKEIYDTLPAEDRRLLYEYKGQV